MQHISFRSLLLSIVVLHFYLIYGVSGEPEEDTWMEPDAWARDHLSFNTLQSEVGNCCKCSDGEAFRADNPTQQPNHQHHQKATEDGVSLMYFKKFITLLFNRKKLKFDSTLQTYERTLIFTLQPSQLDKLHKLQDPRDLDNLLTEIFENVRIPNMYRDGHTLHTTDSSSGFKALVFDIFADLWQLTKTSEIRFLMIATLVMIIGWYINNRYNIGWVTLIIGGIFLYGYLHTYLECNRELEVAQMLEILNQNKGSQEKQNDSRFFSFLKSIFSSASDSNDLEQQKLKKSAKISLGFCRPDHVLIIYFNDIFLKYLQVLLEQCTNTLTQLKDSLPFPFNYFAGLMLICMVGYILKLTFKYILSPAAWSHLINRNHSQPASSRYMPALNNEADTKSDNDRISGDNLRQLLNVINAASQHNNSVPPPAVSGVEELKEAIEAAPIEISPSVDKKKSPTKIQNNNNLKEKIINENTDVKLEDLSEDS